MGGLCFQNVLRHYVASDALTIFHTYGKSLMGGVRIGGKPPAQDERLTEVGLMKTKTTITDLAEKLRFLMDFDPIDQNKTHTIGELASHLKVSLRTLRFYEQAGLLQPDREGLKRLYSPQDLERLEIIVTLRELEVSLTSIKSLIGLVEIGGDETRIAAMVAEIFSDLARSNRARIEELEVINRRIDVARDAFAGVAGS